MILTSIDLICILFISLYIFISFTISRNLIAVLLSPADLLCFHISVDYIFTHSFRGAVFFFHPSLVALLSLKEIVVERLPYLLKRLRTFAAKHPLHQHLGYPFLMCHARYILSVMIPFHLSFH